MQLVDSDILGVAPAQALAAAVDEHLVNGPQPWMVHVLGVYSDDRDVWLQVAPADNAAASIVLRLSRRATAAHALASLERDAPATASFPRILHVMRPV
jgi:hypothetical protein